MPPRLSKRKQRELEELRELENTQKVEQKSESDEEEEPQASTKSTGFAALGLMDDDDEDVLDDEGNGNDTPESPLPAATSARKKKAKKKRKKGDGAGTVQETIEPIATETSTAKAPKKAKGKGKQKATQGEDEEDLDKILAEFSISSSSQGVRQSSSVATSSSQNALLAVSLPHLDSEAEMRRFFGAKVISSTKAQTKGPRGGRAVVQNLKSNLTKPQPTWWNAAQREGLTISSLTDEEVSAKEERSGLALTNKKDKWWTVQYSDRYRSVTKAFVSAVMIGNVNRFYGIMSRLPWHADTLLQLSEVYRHQEEHAQSVDFLNRALFTYERALIGAFTFTTGANRLDFDRVENRPFYLAIARNVADLQRRGSQRASFEFARLLLSLDPYTDPQGSLLYLDYLSIKAGMHDWLLSFWDVHDKLASDSKLELGCFNVTALPGWAFGRALALRAKADAEKTKDYTASSAALRDAILAFPSVVPLVADKTDISLPGEVRGHPAFAVQVDASQLSDHEAILHLLSHLYAYRSSSLWKIPEHASWLKESVKDVLPSIGQAGSQKYSKRFVTQFQSTKSSAVKRSICRHAFLLSDANTSRRLTSFFPPSILRGSAHLSCDPLPPETAISRYDDVFFEGSEDIFASRPKTRREQELDAQNMARVVPDAQRRQLLMGLFEAHPQLQEMFPEGVVQFAQQVGQFPDEVLDNLLIAEDGGIGVAQPAAGGGGAMPGGMMFEDINDAGDDGNVDVAGNIGNAAGAQVEGEEVAGETADEEGDEEEDDENQDAPIFPLRVIRGLMNRIWGAAPAERDQDDEDSD
ncbi:DUF654-domain-containing protein [Schizopora paradoxa]|uniref:DUF654-domain-containing protein n=1 Tax=Schizopora paradoxa TaxID=27342 RepID=A0A0H2SAC0_9AGAM|nr:DUF654-domain-containing protein [Schizopora paradoxa]